MERDVLSLRQGMVLVAVALLAPATDLLPVVAARRVGSGGWLIGIAVLPLLLVSAWACSRIFCGDICQSVGKPLGYTIIIIYVVWSIATLAAVLRLGEVRMETLSGGVPPALFTLLTTGMAVWMGMGKASALARAAEIFYLVLAVLAAGVLLLAVGDVEWANLRPVDWEELPGAGITAAGVLLAAAPLSVLGERIPARQLRMRRLGGWIAAYCGLITLILMAVVGTMGSRLCAGLEIPYIIMVQGLGVKGAFQRMEAFVAALWLLSDLIFAGGLLRAGREYMEKLTQKKNLRWWCPVMAAAAIMVPWALPDRNAIGLQKIFAILSGAGIGLGLIIPVFLEMIALMRDKKRK